MRTHTALLIATFTLLPLCLLAQENDHSSHTASSLEKLGTVNFTTSCGPAVQPQFNRAVALMHSFQFAGAIAGFHAILATDPTCSMAEWGIALSNWGNPFATQLKSPIQLKLGLEAVNRARALRPKTDRERAWIEAVAQLYTDPATTDQPTRKLNYESAMAAVSTANPEDTEAAIFYALAISTAADAADITYARQLKAGAILDSLFAQYPDHPGLAHYIIHTYDVPALAPRAALAAQHYSEIAPSTAHALHMPSHTFTRVGDWQASIRANIASAASAKQAVQPADELHASDYLVYAYLQTAQDSAAHHVVESSTEIFSRFDPNMQIGGAAGPSAAYFARAAIAARYALERHNWNDAVALQVIPSPYPYTEAITYFAHGLGAAHLHNTAAANEALDGLKKCAQQLVELKESYWVNQVNIQGNEVAAELLFYNGSLEKAVTQMRASADQEDKTEKSVVTPGPLAPARELLADLLLQSNQPAQAFKEYEATLTREPNRFWSLYGAAIAAKLLGDQAKAKFYQEKALSITPLADQPGRPELIGLCRK